MPVRALFASSLWLHAAQLFGCSRQSSFLKHYALCIIHRAGISWEEHVHASRNQERPPRLTFLGSAPGRTYRQTWASVLGCPRLSNPPAVAGTRRWQDHAFPERDRSLLRPRSRHVSPFDFPPFSLHGTFFSLAHITCNNALRRLRQLMDCCMQEPHLVLTTA